MTRKCEGCGGTGEIPGIMVDFWCQACRGRAVIDERIPASDALADAETLRLVGHAWLSRRRCPSSRAASRASAASRWASSGFRPRATMPRSALALADAAPRSRARGARGERDMTKLSMTRHYIADRREYLSNGRRNPTSGGWMVLTWDERRSIYVEGPLYRTRAEARGAIVKLERRAAGPLPQGE